MEELNSCDNWMWIFPYIMVEYDHTSPSKFVDVSVSPPPNMQNDLAKPNFRIPGQAPIFVEASGSMKTARESSPVDTHIVVLESATHCNQSAVISPTFLQFRHHLHYLNSTHTPTSDTSPPACVCVCCVCVDGVTYENY